jgi:hypothetical protein
MSLSDEPQTIVSTFVFENLFGFCMNQSSRSKLSGSAVNSDFVLSGCQTILPSLRIFKKAP